MDGWGYWEWLGYALIAVTAAVPAIGATLSGDPDVSNRTSRLTSNRWWRIVPAVALIGSALIVIANQLGWTHPKPMQSRTVYVATPDPKQAAEIAALKAQITALQHRSPRPRKASSASTPPAESPPGPMTLEDFAEKPMISSCPAGLTETKRKTCINAAVLKECPSGAILAKGVPCPITRSDVDRALEGAAAR